MPRAAVIQKGHWSIVNASMQDLFAKLIRSPLLSGTVLLHLHLMFVVRFEISYSKRQTINV